MKTPLRLALSTCAAWALFATADIANAQDPTVTVDPAYLNLGYMNWFNLPSAGGAYAGGSSWGIPDLTASFTSTTLTLGPNHIGDMNSYWYTPMGQPGATGNKVMDANLYNETTGTYVGTTLTFTGNVLSDTLVGQTAPNGVTWSSVAFIKDFVANYSSSVSVTAPLVNGVFNISLLTSSDPTHHIQYGFETIGSDVWVTDIGQYGTVVIQVPEPSTLAFLGLGALGALAWRRLR